MTVMHEAKGTSADLRERPMPDVVTVADELFRLAGAFHRMRQQFLAAADHDVEWSAHTVLRFLSRHGPARAGTVAEALMADPSTISRQVAALVRDGLVERRADPVDGRASVLGLTASGASVIAEHDEIRYRHFDEMLGDWDESDRTRFAELLARFTNDFEDYKNNWIPARDQQASAEGTH
jgi:DNA-binding MarR family transcriptional regulator